MRGKLFLGMFLGAVVWAPIGCDDDDDDDTDLLTQDGGLNGNDGPQGSGDGPGGSAPGPASRVVGPAGGRVTSADNRLTVEIPRDALATVVTVAITPLANPPPGAIGTAYEVTPRGLPLAKPARVSFRQSGADAAGVTPADLQAAAYTAGTWRGLGGARFEPTGVQTSGEAPRLGWFALVPGLCAVCTTSCDPAQCRFGMNDQNPGVEGKCAAYGNGCSRCVPLCDGDGDGFCPGRPNNEQPGGDCQDGNAQVYPGAPEVCGNRIDDDCDGQTDEGCNPCQSDAECTAGFQACVDGFCNVCEGGCNPANCVFGADMPGTGVAGRCHAFGTGCSRCVPACDADGDGFCPGEPGSRQPGGDCDDNNGNVRPNTPEVCGNGIDDNCDGHVDEACATCGTDMDCPQDRQVCLGGTCDKCENACDPATCRFMGNQDDPGVAGRCVSFGRGCSRCVPNCDADGDGYCPGFPGNGQPGGDCRDDNAAIFPKATEVCGNNVDDDCDGHVDEACIPCTGDDICTQGLQACIDGFCDVCTTGCDPGRCRFGAQNDMPGSGVAGRCQAYGRGCSRCVPACDADGDGFCPGMPGSDQPGGDCNDENAAVSPRAVEVCGNGVDDDCDGRIDEECASCVSAMMCSMNERCTTGR